MSPAEAMKWIAETMATHFPLGTLKDIGDKKDAH